MCFSDLSVGDFVLYIYKYSNPSHTTASVGQVVECTLVPSDNNINTIYAEDGFLHITSSRTMDKDDRATFISQVSSVEDALLSFPEYFI